MGDGNLRKKILFFIVLVSLFILVVFTTPIAFQKESFEQKRERILSEISSSIEEAKAQGKYNCCINPPCTMCYLGDWIWKDGSCHCDEMIAKGEFDKVCPQCAKGIEEGKCNSIDKTKCKI